MDRIKDAQARIDAFFETDKTPPPVHERVCEYAKRGAEAPETLSLPEVRQVCHALVAAYAQMGIG